MALRLNPLFFVLALPAIVGGWGTAYAQHNEADVKAALIFNVARYAEWPPEAFPAGTPMRLCLLGSEAATGKLHEALAQLQDRQIRGRPLEVRAGQRFDQLKPCHVTVLFPGALEKRRVLYEERHTLTVSDGEDFIDQGGIIGLVIENNRVQFEVGLDAAQRGSIRLPAQMLKLARRVRGSG